MKAKLQKVSYYILLSLLAICFVFAGMSLIVKAEDNSSTPTTLTYVSLGDSMTNGYGLNGYANNGWLIEAEDAYPAKFAKYLESKKGVNVDLIQLAVSAQRPEDIRFFLEFDLNDSEAIDIITRTKSEWIALYGENNWQDCLIADWNAKFTSGDYYTWSEQTNNRLKDFGTGATTDREQVIESIALYQQAVKDADIISMGSGNANFGVFMLHKLMGALGTDFGSKDYDWLTLENAIRNLDNETKNLLFALEDELYALLNSQIPNNQMVQDMTKIIIYTTASYFYNYKCMLDLILTENPDVEIVVDALINSFSNVLVTYEVDGVKNVLDVGSIFDLIFGTLNYYQTTLISTMQVLGNPLYANAKFFYAEAEEVELMVEQFARSYDLTTKQWKNVDGVDSLILRERNVRQFNNNIYGLIKPMLDSFVSSYGLSLEQISLQDVLLYEEFNAKWNEHLQDSTKPEPDINDYAPLTLNKLLTVSVFLAIDDASIYASTLTSLDASTFISLASGGISGDLFAGIASTLTPESLIDMSAITQDVQNAVLSDETVYQNTKTYIIATYDDIIRPLVETWGLEFYMANGRQPSAEEQEAKYLELSLSNSTIVTDILFNPNLGLPFAQKYIAYYLSNSLTNPLNEGLKADSTIVGLFHLYARFLIGDGLGVHPTKYGHQAMFDSMVSAYENNYTCQDATKDKTLMVVGALQNVIQEYGDDILNGAYDYLDQNGYIDQFNEYVAQAEQMLIDLQNSLDETVREYIAIAKEQVDVVLKDIKAQIEALKPIAEQIGGEIEKKLNEICAFVEKLEQDIIDGVNSVIANAQDIALAIKEYTAMVSAQLQDFVAMVEEQIAYVSEQISLEIANLTTQLKQTINQAIANAQSLIENALSQENIDRIKADLEQFIQDAKTDFYTAVETLINQYKTELKDFIDRVVKEQTEYIKQSIALIKESISSIVSDLTYEIETAVKEFVCTLKQDIKAYINTISSQVEKEIAKIYNKVTDSIIQVITGLETAITTASQYLLDQITAVYSLAENIVINIQTVLEETAIMLYTQIEYIAYSVCNQIASTLNYLQETITAAVMVGIDAIISSFEQIDFEQIKQEIISLVVSIQEELEQSLLSLFNNFAEKISAFIQVIEQEQLAIISQALESLKLFIEEAYGTITTLIGNQLTLLFEEIGAQLASCLIFIQDLVADTANKTWASLIAGLESLDLEGFKQNLVNTILAAKDSLNAELQLLIDKYNAIYGEIIKELAYLENALAEYLYTELVSLVENIVLELEMVLTAQLDNLNYLANYLVESLVAAVIDELEYLNENGTTIDYEIHPTKSYYLSLGDGSTLKDTTTNEPSYGEKLATALGLDLATQYNCLGVNGMRVEDLRYMIDAEYEPDQYSLAEYSSIVAVSRSVFIREIRKADLITVGFETTTLLTYTLTQVLGATMGQYYEMDWDRYFGENANQVVNTITNYITTLVAEQATLGEDEALIAKVGIEAFVYSYLGYIANIAPTIDKIHEINPNAKVVVVGLDKLPATGFTFTVGNTTIDLADIFNAVIDTTNLTNMLYGANNNHSCFVGLSAGASADNISSSLQNNITVYDHEHNFDLTFWDKDETGHYHSCSCGDRIDHEAHDYVWVVDTVPTPNKAGLRHQECSVCGYTNGVTEVMPKLDKEPNKLLPLYITLSCVAIIGAGVGLFFFVKKKF